MTASRLEELRRLIAADGPVIAERRFFRGAREPDHALLKTPDDLDAFVRDVKSGDSLYFWLFMSSCTSQNYVLHVVQPDETGRVPVGGAY
ncbi:MAG: hypothetical protein QM817_38520 [Archangium sp.]